MGGSRPRPMRPLPPDKLLYPTPELISKDSQGILKVLCPVHKRRMKWVRFDHYYCKRCYQVYRVDGLNQAAET